MENNSTIIMISTQFLPTTGGVVNHILNLANEYTKNNLNVEIIHPSLEICELKKYRINNIHVHSIPIGSKFSRKLFKLFNKYSGAKFVGYFFGFLKKVYYNVYYKQINKYIDNIEIHRNIIFHQHDFISSLILSKKLSKRFPVYFTNHTGEFILLKRIPFNRFFIPLLISHYKHIFAPSYELLNFDKMKNIPEYTYIPNGVDLNKYYKDGKVDILRKKLNLATDDIIVFCPRRWGPTKGVLYFADSIRIFESKFQGIKRIKFLFAGNDYNEFPEYKTQVNQVLDKCKFKNNIILLGDIDYSKMPDYMRMSDIVVVPSLLEATSLAILEALACGKIVLATNVGGTPEIIEHGVTGFLVEPENSMQIANQLINIITMAEERKESISSNAINFVKSGFDWQIIAKKTSSFYNLV